VNPANDHRAARRPVFRGFRVRAVTYYLRAATAHIARAARRFLPRNAAISL